MKLASILTFLATATLGSSQRNYPGSEKISRLTLFSEVNGGGANETIYALGIGCRNLNYISFAGKVKSLKMTTGTDANFADAYCYFYSSAACNTTTLGFAATYEGTTAPDASTGWYNPVGDEVWEYWGAECFSGRLPQTTLVTALPTSLVTTPAAIPSPTA